MKPQKTLARLIEEEGGYTLVEILVVIIIIGILAALIVPRLTGRTEQARRAAAVADINALSIALDLYELDNGFYPNSSQGLKALLVKPESPPAPKNWAGPYLKKGQIPTDPWGNAYVYANPGSHNTHSYDLSSLGSDGQEGGGDDVCNWEAQSEQD